jgi:LPXTG-motif cell wall-anchored protein
MGKLNEIDPKFHSPEEIDNIIKLCGGCNLLVCALGAGASYLLYEGETGSSSNSWLLGIGLAIIGSFFYLIILFNKEISTIKRWSGAGVIICTSFSYLFTNLTISPFIYNKMPPYINLCGLLLVLSVHLYWIAHSFKSMQKIFNATELRSILYKENGDEFTYSNGAQQKIIEEKLKRRYFPHPILWLLIAILSPVSFFLHKLLAPIFGGNIFHMILAAISLPIALLFNGLLISTILVNFYYPRKLKLLTGKEVRISSKLAKY